MRVSAAGGPAQLTPVLHMLSILMPVYNERERVERAIAEVLATELPDGVRADRRRRRLDRRHARDPAQRATGTSGCGCSSTPHNQGKGAAIQTALREARGEFSAIFDADLEYDPDDLALLMPPLMDGRTNACLRRARVRRLHEPLVPVRAGQQGRDARLQRPVQRVPARHHDLPQDDPDRRVPAACRCARPGSRSSPRSPRGWCSAASGSSRCPVHYRARATEEGKKLTALDGFRVIGTLLRCRFSDPSGGELSAITRHPPRRRRRRGRPSSRGGGSGRGRGGGGHPFMLLDRRLRGAGGAVGRGAPDRAELRPLVVDRPGAARSSIPIWAS